MRALEGKGVLEPEFIDRLRLLIEEFTGGVYSRFGKFVAVSPTTMQRYLEGRASPGYRTIRRVCQKCNVTPNWLLFGWEPKYGAERPIVRDPIRIISPPEAPELDDHDFIVIPVLNAAAWPAANQGVTLLGPASIDHFTVAWATLGETLIAFSVRDEAMAPETCTGDLLIVDREKRDPLTLAGQLVLAQLDGAVGPRRLVKEMLLSNNSRRFPPSRANKRKILGAVVEIRRDQTLSAASKPED